MFKREPVLDTNGYKTAQIADTIGDNDKNKPIVLDETRPDFVKLAVAGQVPEGFIVSIEDATEGGLQIITYDDCSMKRVTAKGAMSIGDFVEVGAGAAAAGVANADHWPPVSVHTKTVADTFCWRVISSGSPGSEVVADGDTKVTIEKL